MKKLCVIFDSAPRYREEIYSRMEAEYDCDWYFGMTNTDIKEMNLSLLRNVFRYKIKGNLNRLYWQCGILSLIFNNKYNTYLVGAESRAISKYLFVLAAKVFRRKKRIYMWTHGWYGRENKILKYLKRIMFKNCDGVILYGNYAKQEMEKNGFDSSKLHVIHNSLHYSQQLKLRNAMVPKDIYMRHFGNDNKVICFIGRLTQIKKLDKIISAVSYLKEKGDNYNVIFIGDGENKGTLEEQVKKCKLEKQVWFYGACYDEAINAELVYNADVCVSPGNVGLTAMHSMMFGTPVISQNDYTDQMPEFEAIKKGITGDFFDPKIENDLAAAIHRWFDNNRNNREEVRRACYDEIDTSWNPNYQMKLLKSTIK